MKWVRILPLLGVFTLTACQRDKIEVYKAPKEAPSAPVPMAPDRQTGAVPSGDGAQLPSGHPPVNDMGPGSLPEGSGPSDREIQWTLPSGWTEKPLSQMRVGSFAASGKNGQAVDISIVSLAGDAGGDLSNVNRWRGQIELAPISESELAKDAKRILPAGRQMLLVDMAGDKPTIDNKFKKRLVAAIYMRNGQSWFFKMMGEDSAVAENMPSFMKFLESLKFPQ